MVNTIEVLIQKGNKYLVIVTTHPEEHSFCISSFSTLGAAIAHKKVVYELLKHLAGCGPNYELINRPYSES